MKTPETPMEEILKRFLPRQAVETMDEQFGFPQTFLITLTNSDRQLVINAIQYYIDNNKEN